MLRLLPDENFNGDIVRALLLRQPDLDIVRVQDVGLAGVGDPDCPGLGRRERSNYSYARPCDLARLCV
jgi:hypothetical protein